MADRSHLQELTVAVRVHLRRWYWRRVRLHAYEMCQHCGRPVSMSTGSTWWSAHDELWYEVQGSFNGVRCIPCFTHEAQAKGISVYWRPVVDARRTTDGRWVSMDVLFPEREHEHRWRPVGMTDPPDHYECAEPGCAAITEVEA